ncbi:MAG: hypothetical protein ACREGE_00720 [Candidatus Microsaccharimonas sp.]
MRAYHEVSPDQLQSVMANGLKKESRGAKGNDRWIIKADAYLDEHRPKSVVEAGVSRDDTIYAYYVSDTSVITITDGAAISVHDFIESKKGSLLELQLDPRRCFVSDLDTYDALKDALRQHKNSEELETLAKSYWSKLVRLDSFEPNMIRRPEIMITYNLAPHEIERC